MDIQQLLRKIASSPDVKKLSKCVASGVHDIYAGGLSGSSAALVCASMVAECSRMPRVMLYVMSDADEAGYAYHDLMQMLGEEAVLFFPSSYKRAIKYNQRDAANGILRTEVMTRLQTIDARSDGTDLVIVSYPEALAEKVISRDELTDNTITVAQGAVIDLGMLEKRMHDLGMQRTDYVYEPGQYAVRGCIVDVFSYSAEQPFRIDFFGDEVDSIRTFDTQTQLSSGKVDKMTIVPEMQDVGVAYEPILEFLPENTIVVARDIGYVCDKVAQIYSEGFSAQAVSEDAASQLNSDLLRDHVIVCGDVFRNKVETFRLLHLTNHCRETASYVGFGTMVQPLFHKNFDLVNTEFHRYLNDGYRILIFSDSEKQVSRLDSIFKEIADNEPEYGRIRFTPVLKAIHEGYVDDTLKICFFTDHQIFDRFHKYNLKSDKARQGKVALTLKEIQQFAIGDYVVHIDHGIGRFGGLVCFPENGFLQEKIKIDYADGGSIYVSIHALHKVSKYKGKEGEPPRVNKLGSGAWERIKERVKTKVKDIARDLIKLYAQRRKEKGFAFSPDGFMQHELEASFTYEDTPDQLKTTLDVKADMESERPMDRLVCGDVGFGKTEIAVRAAFKAACDDKQVAVLVPTTVLAYQHYQTFSKRLRDFPVKVEYLSRARTAKQQREIVAGLADGSVNIVIGTHKLIGKTIKFKDLGLLIIDEEQKFGVSVKEKLKQIKVNVDTLTMTATPIPRTLQFSLMGARDLSCIQTPPPNRYPIQTEIHTFSAEFFAEAVNFEMSRNGQVYIVNNRINNLQSLADMIKQRVPDARICIGHGRMNPEELEKVVLDFMNYDYDVLISTTIVENGIDVPNANTIIINGANNYGLSDLHQMRGRVGRGNRKAFCYLIAPPLAALSDDSRRRLQAIENFSDLGSGIHIAMQDLDIRGAGNMLGAEQSGFIADLGYETYQKVLNEAVAELRETEFQEMLGEVNTDEEGCIEGDVFVDETNIESELPAYLPEEYVPSSGERMSLYRELDAFTQQRQLDEYRTRLIDRFGAIPEVGEELLRVMPLKWKACKLGFEKITLKNCKMTMYLPHDNNSPYYQSKAFSKVIAYASWHPRDTKLRDAERRSIVVNNVNSIDEALQILTEMDADTGKK